MISLRIEVRGYKYEAVENASFIVYTRYKVRCSDSWTQSNVDCMKVPSYILFILVGYQ